MMKIRILFCIMFLYLLAIKTQAQKTICSLPKVSSDGFYAIPISPQLSGFYTHDQTDIRILDSKNRQVPFVTRYKKSIKNTQVKNDLPIISNTTDSSKTSLIFHNPTNKLLSSIFLRINNNNANRIANLSGSNDLVNWFSIAENISLIGKDDVHSVDYLHNIFFPTTNFKYLQLTINNGKNKPLLIQKVFYDSMSIDDSRESSSFQIPMQKFSQIDSGNFTILKINNDSLYQIEAIKISIYEPYYVSRSSKICNEKGILKMFFLTSDTSFVNFIPTKSNQIRIIIDNEDNPHIKINFIKEYIANREIVAYLHKNESYHLQLQNGSTVIPNYDLAKFVDSIPLQLPVLTVTSFQNIIEEKVVPKPNNKIWMWLAIAVVIGVLSALTYKLTKEAA